MGFPGEARPCAPVGWVPAGAPQARPTNASAWVRTERDQTSVPVAQWQERSTPVNGRVPSNRRDQPRPLNGVQREKGLTLQPPDRTEEEGLEHSNHRPMLPAEDLNTPRQQHSLVGRYLSVRTRAEGGTPRFLWRETLEKPDNAVIINRPKHQRKGFGGPHAQSVQFISIKFTKVNWQLVSPPRARYFRHLPRLSTRRSHSRISRLARARCVSNSAFCRQLTWAPRSRPRRG